MTCTDFYFIFYPPFPGISSCVRIMYTLMCLHTWRSPAICFRAGSDLGLVYRHELRALSVVFFFPIVTGRRVRCGMIHETNTPYILKHSLIGSRQVLNPGPFCLQSPALPSQLPCCSLQTIFLLLVSSGGLYFSVCITVYSAN